jgi:hypothetical protein
MSLNYHEPVPKRRIARQEELCARVFLLILLVGLVFGIVINENLTATIVVVALWFALFSSILGRVAGLSDPTAPSTPCGDEEYALESYNEDISMNESGYLKKEIFSSGSSNMMSLGSSPMRVNFQIQEEASQAETEDNRVESKVDKKNKVPYVASERHEANKMDVLTRSGATVSAHAAGSSNASAEGGKLPQQINQYHEQEKYGVHSGRNGEILAGKPRKLRSNEGEGEITALRRRMSKIAAKAEQQGKARDLITQSPPRGTEEDKRGENEDEILELIAPTFGYVEESKKMKKATQRH